jgi:acetyltransferase-like isoleucine patch superfamily enzyme
MLHAPQDAASMYVKRALLRWRGTRIGSGTKIWRDVWIDQYSALVIGNEVTIGKSVMLVCVGGVEIQDRVMIGHGSKLMSGGHRIPDSTDEPMRWSGPELAPISVEADAWLGAGVIVLPGVTIGKGAVVAAGAVVTKSIPPYAIAAGVPAGIIRQRTPPAV